MQRGALPVEAPQAMCGFLVTLGYDGPNDHHKLGALKRRGPDDLGFWSEGPCRMVQTRLSVVDPEGRSLGPLVNDEWAIVFNGEIYNYTELAKRPTHGDALALLDLWTESKGDVRCLDRARGFWAFVAYHRKRKKLVAVRDPIGIRPLYKVERKGFIAYASTLGTLRDVLPGPWELDYEGLSSYVRYQICTGETTFLRDIKRVVPCGEANWRAASPHSSPQALAEAIESTVHEALTESDHAVATTCSGGLDSSLVTAIAKPELAFHGNYAEDGCNETPWAKLVPGPHRLFVKNLEEHPKLCDRVTSLVEDFSDPAVGSVILPLDELFATIATRSRVVLSGTGGDELFGGYPRYLLADGLDPGDEAYEPRKEPKGVERCRALLTKGDPSLFTFFEEPKIELPHDGATLLAWDRKHFLPALCLLEDAIAGRHGIEVRPPLLSPPVVRLAAGFSAKEILRRPRKRLLRKVASKYLPDAIVNRTDKMGFTVPVGRFVRENWHAIREQLAFSKHRHLYRLDRLRHPVRHWSREVWGVLLLDAWLTRYA